MIVTEHVQCLFRAPPISECGRVLIYPQVTPHWPLAVVVVAIVGVAVLLWLDAKNPVKHDR